MQALVALLDESSRKRAEKEKKGFIRMKIKCFVAP